MLWSQKFRNINRLKKCSKSSIKNYKKFEEQVAGLKILYKCESHKNQTSFESCTADIEKRLFEQVLVLTEN